MLLNKKDFFGVDHAEANVDLPRVAKQVKNTMIIFTDKRSGISIRDTKNERLQKIENDVTSVFE